MIRNTQGIADVIGMLHPKKEPIEVKRILFDSRQFTGAKDQIFFAIKGFNHDGHDYIDQLYEKGIRAFVLMDMPETVYDDAIYLQTDDSFAAIQIIATFIREEFKHELIAVTGSNGKTVVKEWLYRLVAEDYDAYRSPKSFNSQLGVPLSVWSMPEDTNFGIFEAGISGTHEMQVLEDILKPTAGIFTNIGSAHGENFESKEQKVLEKLKLFKGVNFLVAPAQDPEMIALIRTFCKAHSVQLFDWSYGKTEAAGSLELIEHSGDYCSFKLSYSNKDFYGEIPFGDEASIQNAVNALCVALMFDVKENHLQEALIKLPIIEMRLEMKEGHQDTVLINDAYNSDFESLRIALHFLKEHGRDRKKVLILSDMLQSGFKPKELRKQIREIVAAEDLERVITIGPILGKERLNLDFPVHCYKSTEAFIRDRLRYNWEHRAILLKGSRPFRFEQIDQLFARQRHETVMEIHLNRLVHNLNYYRSLLKENTRLMVMVKAFAYGAGSEEIARVLAFHGVDYLAVAYADEGVALRQSGIEIPILVLNPETAALDSFFDYNLEPEIYSFARFSEFHEMAIRREANLKIHIKLETGMNRLGFGESDIKELLRLIQGQKQLKVASVFSHLAASDDPNESNFTKAQINCFRQMSAEIEEALSYPIFKHIANTGAIESFPEAYFDMVRLGIGLYGVAPHPEKQKQLMAVAELKATVSQVKAVQKGDTVGYGRAWQADKDQNIAIISIGYADGFSRSLGEGKGAVMIHGKSYPIIGRVCMDMCMISVGADPVKEGDEVLIFGNDLPVQKMAEAMNTIAYEVLTGISSRVKRVYFMA
ncbi:MAG: bifunctional UDP-N-acetylmuramoyl-tripeptide:D-alanyl-D-alanine ligase/alanine racemase [Bacteroidetes bacterium]|nr:bifunctional UDP-N-acetylmuramoyl-tripeptide:D-alanyl-D-alanine ligase/alanine racemase [Bacteroidota bacterium]